MNKVIHGPVPNGFKVLYKIIYSLMPHDFYKVLY